MEKCRIPKYIHMGIICNKLPQTLHGILVCLRLTYVKGNLLLKIRPSVCHRVVHMHRIPHDIRKKTHRIIMKLPCSADLYVSAFTVIRPL